jgi:hypothetical protein
MAVVLGEGGFLVEIDLASVVLGVLPALERPIQAGLRQLREQRPAADMARTGRGMRRGGHDRPALPRPQAGIVDEVPPLRIRERDGAARDAVAVDVPVVEGRRAAVAVEHCVFGHRSSPHPPKAIQAGPVLPTPRLRSPRQ